MGRIGPVEIFIVLATQGLVFAGLAVVVLSARGPRQARGTPAGRWARDPNRRHQLRWWGGARWSASVFDDGALVHDPL